MSEVIGRGTIELVGDARKLKASIEDAKKSIRTLGEGQRDISKSAQRSIPVHRPAPGPERHPRQDRARDGAL